MKKILIGITAGIIILSLSSCSDDQYLLEKKYYSAQKQAGRIFTNPKASPPNELLRVTDVFQAFIQKYPQTNLAVEAEFTIANLYTAKEEYEKAREQLKRIITAYKEFPDISVEAAFLIGNSYEKEDKWPLALEAYKKILHDYPKTRRSLTVPLYIARYYKKKFQPDKMLAAYKEAINHYTQLTQMYPQTLLAYAAYNLRARSYITTKNWQEAIDTFITVREKFKSKVRMDGVLLNMASIYYEELKDYAKAKEALTTLIKDYPQSRLLRFAKKLLEEINKK